MPLPIPRFMIRARLRELAAAQRWAYASSSPRAPYHLIANRGTWSPPLRSLQPGEDWVDLSGIDPTPLQVARET